MFVKPPLTIKNLKRIAKRSFGEIPSVSRIGVTGSFCRDDFTYNSDVDIVIDCTDTPEVIDGIDTARYLLNQYFIRQSDYIRYDDIEKGVTKPGAYNDGYKQMKRDLVWIYERGIN